MTPLYNSLVEWTSWLWREDEAASPPSSAATVWAGESHPSIRSSPNLDQLTLSEAKRYLDQIRHDMPKIQRLAPLNVLLIETIESIDYLHQSRELSDITFNLMQVMPNGSMQMQVLGIEIVLERMLSDALQVANRWRFYTFTHNQEQLDQANALIPYLLAMSAELKKDVDLLPVEPMYKTHAHRLAKCMQLFGLLSENSDLLKQAQTSTTEHFYPSLDVATFEFYQRAMNTFSLPLQLFADDVKEITKPIPSLKVRLGKMARKHKGLSVLNTQFVQLKKCLDPYCKFHAQEFPQAIDTIRKNPSVKQIFAILQHLDFFDFNYLDCVQTLILIYPQFYSNWERLLKQQHQLSTIDSDSVKGLLNAAVSTLEECQACRKKFQGNKGINTLLNEIEATVLSAKSLPMLEKAFIGHVSRPASGIVQTWNGAIEQMKKETGYHISFMTVLKIEHPNIKLSTISHLNLISQWILNSLSSLEDQKVIQKITDSLQMMVSFLITAERRKESSLTKKQEYMEKALEHGQQMCADIQAAKLQLSKDTQLKPFLDFIDHFASTFEVTRASSMSKPYVFSGVFGFFYTSIGNEDAVTTTEDVTYIKNSLQLVTKLYRKLNDSNLAQSIEQRLQNLIADQGDTDLPKKFWKLQLEAFQFMHEEVCSASDRIHDLLENHLSSCKTPQTLISILQDWSQHVERSVETLKAMNAQFNILMETLFFVPGHEAALLYNELHQYGRQVTFIQLFKGPIENLTNPSPSEFPPQNLSSLMEELIAQPDFEKKTLKELAPHLIIQKKASKPSQAYREDVPPKPSQVDQMDVAPKPSKVHKEEVAPKACPSYLQVCSSIEKLKKLSPIPVGNNEKRFSLFERKDKMENSAKNSLYLIALLEEEKEHPELKSLFRETTDPLRLLERVQKIALVYLPIPHSTVPTKHLIEDPETKHFYARSHDGIALAQLLSRSNPIFDEEAIRPYLKKEKHTLQVAYWFQGKQFKDANAHKTVTDHCKRACLELAEKQSQADDSGIVSLRTMKRYVNKGKRRKRQQAFALPETLCSVQESIQKISQSISTHSLEDNDAFNRLKKTLNRTLDFIRRLDGRHKDANQSPILFTNRHAEVQICLLSTVMQMRLLCIPVGEEDEHPLFLDKNGSHEERPLIHYHDVSLLWDALAQRLSLSRKAKNGMARKLQMFVGDPRYPYPNKTAISDELIQAFNLVNRRRTSCKSEEALATVKKEIGTHLARVMKKTRFALEIACDIFLLSE